jgi:hypothetical protein
MGRWLNETVDIMIFENGISRFRRSSRIIETASGGGVFIFIVNSRTMVPFVKKKSIGTVTSLGKFN